jgi:membrane protein
VSPPPSLGWWGQRCCHGIWQISNYDATYGSLGAAIGLMVWMWMSSIVIFVGAELNSEIEYQTARDSTTGHEKPLGQRGAAMADTVGEEAGQNH